MIVMKIGPVKPPWPPILGPWKSVVIALTYMRRNRVQDEITETYTVSQSTVSRAITTVTHLINAVLRPFVPTADELDDGQQYVVDVALLPCWSWASHPELYSGKHKTTGMNVQVAGTLDARLVWISDPIDGRRHDSYCLGESGAVLGLGSRKLDRRQGVCRKQHAHPHQETEVPRSPGVEKEFNKQINGLSQLTLENFSLAWHAAPWGGYYLDSVVVTGLIFLCQVATCPSTPGVQRPVLRSGPAASARSTRVRRCASSCGGSPMGMAASWRR
jgi:hypothetical protein